MLIVLVLLSLLPFAFGCVTNWLIMTHPDAVLPSFMLVGTVFLLIWAAIAFFAKPYIKSTAKIVISMNTVAFLVLVLNGIQQLLLHTPYISAFRQEALTIFWRINDAELISTCMVLFNRLREAIVRIKAPGWTAVRCPSWCPIMACHKRTCEHYQNIPGFFTLLPCLGEYEMPAIEIRSAICFGSQSFENSM